MYTYAERRRMHRASLSHALAEKRRRLDNVRFYKEQTKPGGPEESANSYKFWCEDESALLADIAGLEKELDNA